MTGSADCALGRVPIGLTASQVTRLQAALTILLSPLDFDGVGAWRTKARQSVQALLGADSSVSLLQIPGNPAFEADDVTPMVEYGAHYHQLDRVNKYRDLGTVAFTWENIGHLWERPSREAFLRSEFYNDWVVRHRLCQPRGLNIALPPGQPLTGPPQGEDVAALYFYQDAEQPEIDRDRQLAMLRTLLPAFTAGTYIAQRVGARSVLAPLVGAMQEGVALLDERAQLVYENSALRAFLADDPEAARVERACAHLGRAVLALAGRGAKSRREEVVAPGPYALRTVAAAYDLRGALVAPGVLARGPMAVVVLSRSGISERRAPEQLRTRYHLTPRELAVAQLLADGHSNQQVARLLGVSIHTTRRHVEHVLMKLGVHSRAAVGAKVREAEAHLSA